jgi:hypothetical protein
MVYAGIIQPDTRLFVVASQRVVAATEIPYIAFLLSKLQTSPLAPPPRPTVAAALPIAPPLPLPVSEPPVAASEMVFESPHAASEPDPDETPSGRRRLALGPQARAHALFGAGALTLVLLVTLWQSIAGARIESARRALIGTWERPDGTRLVFKPDGTGAITRPDPTYGNRTHLFRWERRGELLALTEKRILLPGGTRQTAKDSLETLALSANGRELLLGRLALRRSL